MKVWQRLAAALGIASSATAGMAGNVPKSPEHAVIIHFNYGSTDLEPLFNLEQRLEEAINQAGAGELDGNEVAADGHDGYLYLYGPDADRLYQAVASIVEAEPFMKGATVRKRYGPPGQGAREVTLTLSP